MARFTITEEVSEEFKSVVISRHYRGNKVLSYALRDLQHAKTEKIGEYRVTLLLE